MKEFTNVTVIKAANIYFGGKVTSRTLLFPDGSRKTLGVMLPGEYEFGTSERELMEVTAGSMTVQLPDAAEWRTFRTGESFTVPAGTKFKLKVDETVDYCCSYFAD